MQFTTPVDIPHTCKEITYQDKILLLGSCFADNMTKHLQSAFFQVSSNPFGTLYNPASIASCLQLLQQTHDTSPAQVASSIPLARHNGLWHSMLHHGDFSTNSKDDLMLRITQSLEQGVGQLSNANVLILTWGTAWVYEQNGAVVSNCHKIPASQFNRRCLSVKEILTLYHTILQLPLLQDKHIIFTVSPIRHLNDGLHANQLSKSVLLLAIDQLIADLQSQQQNPSDNIQPTCLDYFPSYEILLDELRDYRFYADDMLHPSEKAVEYIWERFTQTYFSCDTLMDMQSLQKLYTGLHHTPLHPDTADYQRFLEHISEQLRQWHSKYNWIDPAQYIHP